LVRRPGTARDGTVCSPRLHACSACTLSCLSPPPTTTGCSTKNWSTLSYRRRWAGRPFTWLLRCERTRQLAVFAHSALRIPTATEVDLPSRRGARSCCAFGRKAASLCCHHYHQRRHPTTASPWRALPRLLHATPHLARWAMSHQASRAIARSPQRMRSRRPPPPKRATCGAGPVPLSHMQRLLCFIFALTNLEAGGVPTYRE